MSRKCLFAILACLLSLLPVSAIAQSLTQCEYWLDDDFSNRKTIALSGAEDEIDTKIDVASLTSGVHELFFRFRQSDGAYSAISSRRFSKFGLGDSKVLEYWFDGNRAKSQTLTGVTPSDDPFAIDFSDIVDCTALVPGFHTVSYRVVCDNGLTSSSVVTKAFLKYSGLGDAKILEYWFDDNRKDIKRVAGVASSDDGKAMDFIQDVDLSQLSAGHHRLYCRVVSKDGLTNSAVSMTPIMVRSKYDNVDPASLTMTDYAYWFDDEEAEVITKANPKVGLKLDDGLDARRLSDGKHTLHMQFGNSAGIWNGPIDFPFTKEKMEEPKIVATANAENGVVTIKFNSVPGGVKYFIMHKYPSGKARLVTSVENREYPADLKVTDSPAPGDNTYYVEGKYTDADGVLQPLRSAEVSVTVEKSAYLVKTRSINGVVEVDGNPVQYKLYINGEEAKPSKYWIDYMSHGRFTIRDIPVGTEITIGVKSSGYKFDDISLIVNENISKSTYRFRGTKGEEDDQFALADDAVYDLIMTDKIRFTPTAWEIEVMNKSSKKWKGDIIVKIISKDVKDMYDKEASEGLSYWFAGLDKGYVYTTTSEQHVELDGRKSKLLVLDIKNMPDKDKKEDYYVYVFSRKDGQETEKVLEAWHNSSDCRIPQVLEFNPVDWYVALNKGFTSYIEGYKAVIEYMKKFAAWGDPFKLEWESAGKAFDLYVKRLEKGEVDLADLNEDVADVAIKSGGMLLNCFFIDMHKAVKKYTKDIKASDTYQIHSAMATLYDRISGTMNALNADDNHKFFELAKQVLTFSKDFEADPVLNCYKTFFEVGDAMVKAIERMSKNIFHAEGYKLYDGKCSYKIKVRRYSSDGELSYFRGSDFYPYPGRYGIKASHNGQIESITIELTDPTYRNNKATSMPLKDENITFDYDGITIKGVEYKDKGLHFTNVEAWMIIKWKNNRVTRVPLLDQDFVKVENLGRAESVPLTITVELQSETYGAVERIANQLTFVKP